MVEGKERREGVEKDARRKREGVRERAREREKD
jgi:hypothetical protein